MSTDGQGGGRRWTVVDLAIVAALVIAGAATRAHWASGLGLGDDMIFRGEVNSIVVASRVLPDNQAYRFTWWLPAALSVRLFGLQSFGLVLPFTLAALLGTVLVYAIGRHLWGRTAGVLAAVLVTATPLDFAWSTLLTPDLMLSAAAAGAVLFVLRALEAEPGVPRRRAWLLAAVCLWLATHAKVSGVFLVPPILLAMLGARERLGREVTTFFLTAGVLFAASGVSAYALHGDPLFAVNSELKFQGLTGPLAVRREVTSQVFWYFPGLLFLPNVEIDTLVFAALPYALIVLVYLARGAGVPVGVPFLWWWLLFMFAGHQFNFQRVDGVWIAGFRNLRHLHAIVHPMALLVAGLLVSLAARRRWLAPAIGVVVVLVGVAQSVESAARIRITFSDRREACRVTAALAAKPVYLDQPLFIWCGVDPPERPAKAVELPPNPEQRRPLFAAAREGYVVTGGGRCAVYGCAHCIPTASELPPEGWRMIHEGTGPVGGRWRPEPLRVWEYVGPS